MGNVDSSVALGPPVGHAVWVSPHDVELLAETGTMVEHLPASNFRIGSGIAPMLARGVPVALETDGMASSDNQAIFEAMRVAVFASNARTPNQDEWLRPSDVLPMRLDHTKRVLGVPYRLGRVRRGYRADLVLLRKNSTSFHPANDFVNQLVLAENGSAVDTVIVDGRVVIRNGRAASLDEAAIMSAIDAAAASIRARNSKHASVSKQLAPFVARARSALNTDLVATGRAPARHR